MNNIQWFKLFLAVLVIFSFSAAGVGIALKSMWVIVLSIILGFVIMGYGISLKRKEAK
ncbi:hypothetical protein SAMN04487944_11434 [Gracilibacillus ureilyticus]|uniref:Uncharacterized protein n=1 Tax=Gracilibacillus ureilyticus TaxID=531814 RepID=A0A1H9TJ18_9BACI|nr:DUF5325 family protein [Gracilibacillus ureilyticus]SER97340.1 hypothetical protein SAMN04487944_11434 [Gracilibacillus ureilyticus]